ncbi:hypothetical protein ACFL1R_05830 [Candidatus Latescibacterota bacterium]
MNPITVVKNTATIITLLIITALFSCDIKSPTEGLKVLFNEDPLTIIVIEVVDTKTNKQIVTKPPDNIQITISGPDKNAITNLTESPKTSFVSTSGYFNFAVADDFPISSDHPFSITLMVSSPDYISISKSITLTSTKGEFYSIAVVKRDAPPEGAFTSTNNEGATSTDGKVKESIVIVSDPEPFTNTGVNVNIPEGTTIKDENGNVLTGELKTEITDFNVKSEEALNAFPGGVLPKVSNRLGELDDVIFKPAAFISLDITDTNGNKANTFDKPVEIIIHIPGDIYNPETGTLIKKGDILPIFYYEEENALWMYHSDQTISGSDENGNYEVFFTTTHLSYWTVGWEDKTSEMCDQGINIHVTGGFTTVEIKVKNLSDDAYFSSIGNRISSSEPYYSISKYPRSIPVAIEAWYGTDLVGVVEVEDLCGEDVYLEVTIPGKAVVFSVEVYDINDPEKRMRPNRAIYIDDNGDRKYVGYMMDGKITVYGLEEGIEYTCWVYHEGTWYSDTYTVNEKEYAEIKVAVEL